MNKIIIIAIFLGLTLVVGAQKAEAQVCYKMVSYTGQDNFRGSSPLFDLNIFNTDCFPIATKGSAGNYTNFQDGFRFLFNLLIGVCIALAVILFTYGAAKGIIEETGLLGGRDPNAKDYVKGKKQMQNALIGLLVVLSIWLIMNTVNPDLVRLPMFQGISNISTDSPGTGDTDAGVTVAPE